MKAAYNWKDDPFLRVHLAETARAPEAVKGKKFEKQITFVIKQKYGPVLRKTAPLWAKEAVENGLNNDPNVDRYFIEE